MYSTCKQFYGMKKYRTYKQILEDKLYYYRKFIERFKAPLSDLYTMDGWRNSFREGAIFYTVYAWQISLKNPRFSVTSTYYSENNTWEIERKRNIYKNKHMKKCIAHREALLVYLSQEHPITFIDLQLFLQSKSDGRNRVWYQDAKNFSSKKSFIHSEDGFLKAPIMYLCDRWVE